jgi:hypothetical protein
MHVRLRLKAMALDILEWGIIGVMVVSIFIWGPEKVPEIAKTIGNARRDIESYTKQFQGISKELTNSVGTGNIDAIMGTLTGLSGGRLPAAPEDPAQAPPIDTTPAPVGDVSGDTLLIDMAKKLKISTRGKTRDQIQSEIISHASQGPATPVVATQVTPSGSTEPPTAQETPAPEPETAAPAQEPSAQSPSAS